VKRGSERLPADEERPLWEQLPGENATWYARFKGWLSQDKPRSMLAAYNGERARKGTSKALCLARNWQVAKDKYRWAERAAAWNIAEQERLDQEYEELRKFQVQRELARAAKLYDKGDELMELPVTKQVDEGEDGTVIVMPDHKAFKTAADLYAEARVNARTALGMDKKKDDDKPAQQNLYLALIQHIRQRPIEREPRAITVELPSTNGHSNGSTGHRGD
jgi:hypothetical protein